MMPADTKMPTSSDSKYPQDPAPQALVLKEQGIEEGFIEKLRSLKYTYRPDIRDRAALERNFREKFEALNRVRLTEAEFDRLLEQITTADVFAAAKTLRTINDFTRDDGTPLNFTLVNIKDWCKNTFVQQRIKDQKYPNRDLPRKGREKLDIVIAVDMLLTGFDSQYLNTLYVDKNLKHHGLVQAFSRTNRILNATKPYGNILDFRQQQSAVEEAITLFSGQKIEQAREIWLVEKAPVVIKKLESSVRKLGEFMKSQGLTCQPQDVPKLKGDDARSAFINQFKEVQRLKTQLDQYTDLTQEHEAAINKRAQGRDISGLSAYEQK